MALTDSTQQQCDNESDGSCREGRHHRSNEVCTPFRSAKVEPCDEQQRDQHDTGRDGERP